MALSSARAPLAFGVAVLPFVAPLAAMLVSVSAGAGGLAGLLAPWRGLATMGVHLVCCGLLVSLSIATHALVSQSCHHISSGLLGC